MKKVNLLGSLCIIVGSMVGSGIFIAPKGVLRNSGNVGLSLIIWLATGIFSTFGALCYAELGTCIKKSGAHYIYILETLGPMLAFLRLWAQFILIRRQDIVKFIAPCWIQDLCPCHFISHIYLITSSFLHLCLAFAVAVNCWSVTFTTRLQIVLTTVKMGALVLIIVPGMIKLASGKINMFFAVFSSCDIKFLHSKFLFLFFVFFRNIPLSIILSMITVIIFYLLTNISYYTVMTSQEVLESNAVAVTFADRALQGFSSVIPVFVAVSCFGSLIGGCFSTPRMLFSGSREGQWPVLFSMIHIRRHTPLPAYPLMVFMILAGEIFGLINFYSFSRWMFTGLTTLGLIVHRYQHPDLPRPFKVLVPLLIPAVYTVVCFFIVGMSLYSDPVNTGIGLALTLTGIPVYFLMVKKQRLPLCFIRVYRKYSVFNVEFFVLT
uniref:Cystine/glutamate transporter-like n=1 Tax=Erpetoichthys calabaricus TaxID=27687 RepID=A0A8C4RUD4_ERPCA